jgi:isoleucyl-tRNA synthetase
VRLSEPILRELSQGHATIRGALHSALGHLHDFDPARDAVPLAELLPPDARARERLTEVVARVLRAYEAYEFHLVYAAGVDFCASGLQAV